MVLSFQCTMPPSIEESIAFMAKNIAKLIATNTLHNKQLATSNAKLKLINKELTTANAQLLATISKTTTQFLTASSPVNMIEYITTQNTPTAIIPLSSITPPLNNEELDKTKASNPTHNMVQVQLANSLKLCGTALRIITATNLSTNYRSTQNQSVGLPLQCLNTTDIQAYKQRALSFYCPKVSLSCHQCGPPKLVFLRSESKPPWEPRDSRYKTMILANKYQFQEGSIDACLKLRDQVKQVQLIEPNIIYEDLCMNATHIGVTAALEELILPVQKVKTARRSYYYEYKINAARSKFNSIKDAKELLAAIEKRFGGNEATRKTQENLLKQQYENFTTSSSKMLDQTFDRL
ncbi:hypothetical protein Tco_1342357 [Tanacetum coccineum]